MPRRIRIGVAALACALALQVVPAPAEVPAATTAGVHVARAKPHATKQCRRGTRHRVRRSRHRRRRGCAVHKLASARSGTLSGGLGTQASALLPSAPTPSEPTPTAPVPASPMPTAPVPTIPAPVPSEPTPTDPAPPADPTPSDPAPPADPAPSEPPASPLRWAPPTLQDPITIELGTGYTHTTLSTTRDYVVKLPPTQKVGATWIEGGHNVVIVGGSVTIPAELPADAPSAQRTAIYIKGATGTVHIEGVLIDGSGSTELDGVDVSAPAATVQLENLRIVGIHGGLSSFHADVVQPWGGVGDLRIDRLTGASNYQGLMLPDTTGAIGSAEISHVDLTATTEPTVDYGGHMILLKTSTQSAECATYPVDMQDVFVVPRPGRTLANSVYPAGVAGACPGMTGSVSSGLPPGGSWVPAGVAGVGYTSPGYQ